jgi:type II secretory pathway component PulC
MRKLSFILILLCLSLTAWAQPRDPFESILPKEDIRLKKREDSAKAQVSAPKLTVEGILWGTDKPQAIINGDVYGVGDVVKGMPQTKIHKIEKGSVIIIHEGIVFQYGTKTSK